MPTPVTPRRLRDEAQFCLDEMGAGLRAIADRTNAVVAEIAHLQRRAAHVNQLRHKTIGALRLAQDTEDGGWDGVTERRRSHRVAQMEAAAAIAGHLRAGVEAAA